MPRYRRVAARAAAGAAAALTVVAAVVSAQAARAAAGYRPDAAAGVSVQAAAAAAGHGSYRVIAWPSLNERSAPRLTAPVVGSLAYGSAISVRCQAVGSPAGRSVVWDRLASGAYVSDYWASTPGHDTWTAGIPRCAPAGGGVGTGRTVSYNEGGTGECTWWAIEEFRAYSGLYPDLGAAANDGNPETKYYSKLPK